MSQNNNELLHVRNKIDDIDQQLLKLLNQRAQCALEIAAIKIKQEGADVEFYRPEREAQVLKKINDQNKGPLTAKSILTIFRTIMTECRHLETSHGADKQS
jgi:chorismate mutase/prephenate dehydratase